MGLGLRRHACAFTLLALGAVAQPAEASHFRYGTLSWSRTGTLGEVEFRLIASFERDAYPSCVGAPCSGPDGLPITGDTIQENQGNTALAFDGAAGISGDFSQVLFFRVIAHSVPENFIIGEALDPLTGAPPRHTYPPPPPPPAVPPGPFVVYLAGSGTSIFGPFPPPVEFPACCRIGQPGFPSADLANRPGLPYPLQTLVDPYADPPNSAPVSTMVPVVVVPPSSAATFQIPAIDPDGDAIRFGIADNDEAVGPLPLTPPSPPVDRNSPPGLTIDSATGLVTWNNLGLAQSPVFWTAQFEVEDLVDPLNPLGPAKTRTPVDFLLLIQPVVANLPSCSISPAGPHTVSPGTTLTFAVTGSDLDGNVTLNTGGIPTGATLTPALPVTGTSPQMTQFSWTPAATDLGAHALIFSATDTDGQQALCQTTILVASGPSCSISAHPSTVPVGTPLSFSVTAVEPDAGQSVTLSGSGVPSGATLTPPLPLTAASPVSTAFSWTPLAADVGSHVITFTATDSAQQTGQCATTVDVIANATAPTCTITPPGPQTVQAGTPVTFTVEGADLDQGDILTLALTSGPLPAGATLNPDLSSAPSTGPSPLSSVFNWTPAATQGGAHVFSFLVTDSAGQPASCETMVTVQVAANNPPVCRIDFLSGPGGPGDDDDDNGDKDDEDDDGDKDGNGDRDDDRDRDRDGDRDRDRDRAGATLRLLADRDGRDRDRDGDDRDGEDRDSDDDDDKDDDDDGDGGGVPPGGLVRFRVTGTDSDAGDVLTLESVQLPLGTVMTPALPLVGNSPLISEGNWTPDLVQVGPNLISFRVTDTAGLQGFCQATVQVVQRPPRCEIDFTDGRGDGDDEDRDDDRDKDRDGDRDDDRDKDRDHEGNGDRSEERHVADRVATREADRDGDNGDRDNGDRDDDDDESRGDARVGERVTFRVTATDPDVGDIITLMSGPLPAGASMDPTLPITGSSPLRSQFNWTPTRDQLGSHVITFTVTDLAGEQGTCRARIDVVRRKPRCPNGGDDEDRDKDRDDDHDKSGDHDGRDNENGRRVDARDADRDRDNDNDRDKDNGDGDDEGCKPEDEDRDHDRDGDRDADHDRRDPDHER